MRCIEFRVSQIGLVAACVAAACSSTDEPVSEPPPSGEFPEGFIFGSATAGFQVEMGCPTLPSDQCDDTASDWYAYVMSPEMQDDALTFLSGDDPSKVGPGHWELYENDYDLARNELHNNSFRMSLEWSRIFPTSTDGIEGHDALMAVANEDALDTYHAMFEAMRARGLEPMVTLHHYTMPTWIHDGIACHEDVASCADRGWLGEERVVRELAKYAGFVAREFGGSVDLWATQNEPFAVVLSAFLQPSQTRSNPPALLLDYEAAKTALRSMVFAHAAMVDAVRENDTADADGDGASSMVGVVHAMAPALPKDPDRDLDRQAAKNTFYIWNLLFLDATARGTFDEDVDGNQTLVDDLAGRMDFIGLNYKMSMRVEGRPTSFLPELSPLLTINPFTLDLSEIHPRGLYEMCHFLQGRYGLPIYITENNGQALWKGDVELEKRYVVENLRWVSYAIDQGVDIRGYYYWAFMDNYEWNHGMDIRLGLYAVDPTDPDKTRTPRGIAPLYGEVAGVGKVSGHLAEAYPVDFGQGRTGGVPKDPEFMPATASE